MKRLIIIAGAFLYYDGQSQTDTVGKITLKSLSLEFMTNAQSGTNGYILPSDFIFEGVKDPLLNSVDKNKDVLISGIGYTSGIVGPMYVVRSAFRLPVGKKHRHEATLGIRYRRVNVGGTNYEKLSYDTLNRYVSTPSTTKALLEIERTTESYNFNLTAHQIGVSLGWNYVSNQSKRLWASVGLEITPGINFAQTYQSIYYITLRKGYVEEGQGLERTDYKQNAEFVPGSFSRYTTGLKKTTFSVQFGMPVSFNMRLSKKAAVLNKMDVGVSLYPGVYFANTLKNKIISNSSINAGIVIRYNFSR